MSWREWKDNPAPKILSFVVAGVLWLTVTNRLDFEDNVEIPMEYVNRPEALATIEPLPGKVQAHVHGKGKFLRYTMRNAVCRIDLGGYQVGQTRIDISGEDVIVPDGVVVNRVEILEPRRITVEFDHVVEREVPIFPALVGTPDPRYVQVGRTFIEPSRARLRGPGKLIEHIAIAHTREIDVSGKRSSIRRTVRLVPPDSPTIELSPSEVNVAITIEPILSRRIDKVTVSAEGSRAHFQPSQIVVELEGAKTAIDAAAKTRFVLALEAQDWQAGGRTLLRVKEIRGPEIVFAAVETFPDSLRGLEDVDPPTGPPAVSGDVIGRLQLPPDVEILGLEPERILVYFGEAPPQGSRGQ